MQPYIWPYTPAVYFLRLFPSLKILNRTIERLYNCVLGKSFDNSVLKILGEIIVIGV